MFPMVRTPAPETMPLAHIFGTCAGRSARDTQGSPNRRARARGCRQSSVTQRPTPRGGPGMVTSPSSRTVARSWPRSGQRRGGRRRRPAASPRKGAEGQHQWGSRRIGVHPPRMGRLWRTGNAPSGQDAAIQDDLRHWVAGCSVAKMWAPSMSSSRWLPTIEASHDVAFDPFGPRRGHAPSSSAAARRHSSGSARCPHLRWRGRHGSGHPCRLDSAVSVDSNEQQFDAYHDISAISATGRYVAFDQSSSIVHVRDRSCETTELISDESVRNPDISANGTLVVFRGHRHAVGTALAVPVRPRSGTRAAHHRSTRATSSSGNRSRTRRSAFHPAGAVIRPGWAPPPH